MMMMMMIWFLVQRPDHVRITDFSLAKLLNNKRAMLSTTREKVNRPLSATRSLAHRLYNSGHVRIAYCNQLYCLHLHCMVTGNCAF